MLRLFAPPPAAPALPEKQVPATYQYWRTRLLYSTFIGYAVYYFVRSNIPVALPLLEKDLGLGKSELGLFLTLHGVVYGVSKVVIGVAADRSNPRVLMAVGLLGAALANLAFGMGGSALFLGCCWIANGWFQGMGTGPCIRILSHWFSPGERGTKWALWATSHQVGTAGVLLLSGYLGRYYGWRAVFLVPGLLALLTSLFMAERLRDTPASLGLPPVNQFRGEPPLEPQPPSQSFEALVRDRVLSNPYVWLICLANFWLYVVRLSFLDWAPTYLNTARDIPLEVAGRMTAGFEVAGLGGVVLTGWLTDRWFRGRRAPVATLAMLLTMVFVWLFGRVPTGCPWQSAACLAMVGFSLYGPQCLVGVMLVDQTGPEAAATVVGLGGLCGYLSTVLSGWGLGTLVQKAGWEWGFGALSLCCLGAAIPFFLCWNCRPRC